MPVNPKKIAPTIRDMFARARVGWAPRRLQFVVAREKLRSEYCDIAEAIKLDPEDHVFVPDTCFFTAHEIPDLFWDSILTKRIAITSSVFRELMPWMESPRCNGRMAPLIATSQDSDGPPVVQADPPAEWGRYWTLARCYYSTLLSSRKDRAFELISDLKNREGRPLRAEESRRLLQQNCSERELMMVLKAVERGRDANWWTDELLVTAALQICICTGQSTSILTRDRDVLDQFERLCSLVTVDYQAYQFGRSFGAYRDRFDCVPMPNDDVTEEYFVTSESLLVRKPVPPNDFVEWVLPRSFHPATISCVLFGGPPDEMALQVVMYQAEQEMTGLMRTKGKTLGCSVELPDDMNCHATGFPTSIPTPREFVIVGRDRWRATPPGTEMRWSRLDYAHAIANDGVIIEVPYWVD